MVAAADDNHAPCVTWVREVLEYIDDHLDADLRADRLAAVAGYALHHFQRRFSAHVGLSVHRYVTLRRIARASYRLAFDATPVVEVGAAHGYPVAETFARAFQRVIGVSPSTFRDRPDWIAWHDRLSAAGLPTAPVPRAASMAPPAVQVVTRAPVRVAAVEHRGDPREVHDAVAALIAFRRAHRVPLARAATYNLLHVDPRGGAERAPAIDVCVAFDRRVPASAARVIASTSKPITSRSSWSRRFSACA